MRPDRLLFNEEPHLVDLPGGERLASAGEQLQGVYRLDAGRLATVDAIDAGGSRILEVHRPGALIGAAQTLTGGSLPSTITALRDSRLSLVHSERLRDRLRGEPMLLAELARLSLRPMRREPADARRASMLGFVAVCDSVAMRSLVEALAIEIRRLGSTACVVSAGAESHSADDLSRLEDAHDFVLMAAERHELAFTEFCGRQIDRLVLVGGAHSPLPEGPFQFAAVAIQRNRLLDIVLVQPAGTDMPAGSARWMTAAPASRLFHVRQGSREDLARLARVFTGRSVGLVLSGGGARAYAHVGVIRALTELGVPVDFVAGTSMGGVIAAGLAMGWSIDELEKRISQAFVSSSPLKDIAFPLLAMSRGREVERRLAAHFGEVDIADLWRAFACASTDLTTGEMRAHRSGRLRDALRATISLPGVLPPVVAEGHVLVDGALVRNLPADLVRDQHDGISIGVDVARAAGLMPDELMLRPPGLRWLTSGAWKKGPPIVSVLIRSATMPTAHAAAGTRQALDLVIEPELQNVQLRDWKAYGPAVSAGYRAAMAQAAPITRLVREAGPRQAAIQIPAYHS